MAVIEYGGVGVVVILLLVAALYAPDALIGPWMLIAVVVCAIVMSVVYVGLFVVAGRGTRGRHGSLGGTGRAATDDEEQPRERSPRRRG